MTDRERYMIRSALLGPLLTADDVAPDLDVRPKATPVEGYGTTIRIVDDGIDPGWRSTTLPDPDSAAAREHLRRAILCRLQTRRGLYAHDEEYGLDIGAFVNVGLNANDWPLISGQLVAEVEKDERVESCLASLRQTTAPTASLVAVLYVTPRIGEAFEMSVDVQDLQPPNEG